NFGDIERKFSDFKKSRVIILPVPYEATTTYKKGTKEGPKAIIDASQNMELYDEETNCEPYKVGIHTLIEFKEGFDSPQKMIEALADKAQGLFSLGKLVIALGGEHTVTLGMVEGLGKKEKDFSILILDAHADLRNSYEKTKYSHACVSRRLIEKNRIVQVGIRSLSQEEADFIKEKNLKPFYAKDIIGKKDWMKEVISRLSDKVYLSLDLDFLDPSIIPAVGTPEPGGLKWYETLKFLRLLTKEKKILGIDVVELCPTPLDISVPIRVSNPCPSVFTAAKLIYKLIAYLTTP
ncbi:agmatinase, partial [bacterium]|nr:agmatinase [bacterium]